jgi:DNA replication initiation complex subunit (GINS family)
VLAKPNIPSLSSDGSVPAPVPTLTGADVIAAARQQSIAHNSLVNANMGRTGGGKKRSKKAKKAKTKAKRSKKAKTKARRSKKAKTKARQSRRCRRGGADPTPTPTPTPMPTNAKLVTVPQFLGPHAGANQASINLNHGGMLMSSQAAYDNTNAPASNHRLP